VQYTIELRNHRADVWNRDIIIRMMVVLFAESAIVLVAAFASPRISPWASLAAVLFGIFMTSISRNKSPAGMVDFTHLSERAMLYVVFTFGEMIIVISAYFVGDGSFDWSVIYFSLMGFLIVAGLFFSYEILYDYLIDRERPDTGMVYMIIHIFIIYALNNITVSLDFMRESGVALLPKTLLITASIAGYVWLSEEGNAFTEHFRSTLNDPDFYPGNIVLMNVVVIAASAIGIISCLFRSEDWQSIIFPGVCGIFGVISYLVFPAYRMGSAWLLHLLLSIGILLLAGSAFFPWLKEKIAERQSR
jgi:low temperature requirement protein LtrA